MVFAKDLPVNIADFLLGGKSPDCLYDAGHDVNIALAGSAKVVQGPGHHPVVPAPFYVL